MLGMFSGQAQPIAIDFGSSSAKLLQVSTQGDQSALLAAAEVPVPEEFRNDAEKTLAFWADAIPKAIKAGKFRGKRAVVAMHSSQTLISHMQLADAEGLSRDVGEQAPCSPIGH